MTEIKLNDGQLEEFEALGYLILPEVFNHQEVQALRQAADRILELMVNSSLATGTLNPRLDIRQSGDLVDVRKVQPVNDLESIVQAASGDDRLLAPMRQLMQAEPILMEEKLNYKQTIRCPQLLERFKLHQGISMFALHHDWGYYRANGYPEDTLSSAISLDDTTPQNGPIRVIPGTHRQDWPLKHPDPSSGNGEVLDDLFSATDRVPVIAPAGSVMLFHSKLLHDSCPNETNQPRRVMIYSHYPGRKAMEEDKRNRFGRESGQAVEKQYHLLVEQGAFHDQFTLSSSA